MYICVKQLDFAILSDFAIDLVCVQYCRKTVSNYNMLVMEKIHETFRVGRGKRNHLEKIMKRKLSREIFTKTKKYIKLLMTQKNILTCTVVPKNLGFEADFEKKWPLSI